MRTHIWPLGLVYKFFFLYRHFPTEYLMILHLRENGCQSDAEEIRICICVHVIQGVATIYTS